MQLALKAHLTTTAGDRTRNSTPPGIVAQRRCSSAVSAAEGAVERRRDPSSPYPNSRRGHKGDGVWSSGVTGRLFSPWDLHEERKGHRAEAGGTQNTGRRSLGLDWAWTALGTLGPDI
ncbi:hypothetical protein NDU88_002145 [Pleurodeles waltl]|uniref:Uncharacterized protein n=1 Tax=Pleurodeles waltl TaxID=8319 RepID=A0AAV7S9K9_PLEWA|nr:hypothetical protein NDU88_002145 [Pleurodeles waltl]